MANKRYVVKLTLEERNTLQALLKERRLSTKKRMRIGGILKVSAGEEGPAWTHTRAAEALDVHVNTVTLVAKQFVQEGLEAAISRKKHRRPGRTKVFVGMWRRRSSLSPPGSPRKGMRVGLCGCWPTGSW